LAAWAEYAGFTVRDLNTITGTIISVPMRIHTALGPGLFESVYETLSESELKLGFSVERQKFVGFEFGGHRFENAFVLDLLVDNRVIVEVKSQERLTAVHEKQVQTYLRLCDCRVGLLINFNEASLKDGIRRIVNRMEESSPRTPLLRLPRVK
jgi:iron complex transport system substrate-binding protein